jgi:small subunit ribosomal protein S8
MQDPLSDMLTRLRNAQMAGKQTVDMPGSKLKVSVAKVLEQEGYIAGHHYDDSTGKPRLHIDLKYYEGKPVIAEIERISKPSLRRYSGKDDLPSVRRWAGCRHCVDFPWGHDGSGGASCRCGRRSPLHGLLIRELER